MKCPVCKRKLDYDKEGNFYFHSYSFEELLKNKVKICDRTTIEKVIK